MLYNDTLFADVQMNSVFPDGKTFVDCTPLKPYSDILKDYEQAKGKENFNLKEFVLLHFRLPVAHTSNYISDKDKGILHNIESLWPLLTRQASIPEENSTLIALPHPYIVPGGRFGEIYYWDSYFTMLGLHAAGNTSMIENMVTNFAFLIDACGHIPNGNRNYFISRSQPPFFSLMIRLLAVSKGDETLIKYLPQLKKEYAFWMKGVENLDKNHTAAHHVVVMPDDETLNRYWDAYDTPRPESYREDVELSHQSAQEPSILFRHLRAGAESGWDYSCRWFKNENDFSSTHTTDIVPVDLNCLLWHLEKTIADACGIAGEHDEEEVFSKKAEKRKQAIQKYCWNEAIGFYYDYDLPSQVQKNIISLAGIAPLFFQLATNEQALNVAAIVSSVLLKNGGVVSTPVNSGQQWDAPNGWAPLQWMTITGLENYQHTELATTIARRWLQLNADVFNRTGKLMEKYNVVDTHLEAGGGEYEGQDGFGWTNGVFLALKKKYP